MDNTLTFFKKIRRPFEIAIEFRHRSWSQNKSDIKELLKKADLIHVTDPFREMPLTRSIHYHRLHGLGKKKYDYKYTDKDLRRLKKILWGYKGNATYVMFNNFLMREDANRFKKLLSKR